MSPQSKCIEKKKFPLYIHDLSPLSLLANLISFFWIVTRLAWIAARLVSSNKETKYASTDSCKAPIAEDWNLKSVLKSWAISLTNLWKGNFLINSSVDFWNLLISLKATVPGLYLWGFLTPPVDGADFLAALEANYFLGALPPVDFLAVCFVLAIVCVYIFMLDVFLIN